MLSLLSSLEEGEDDDEDDLQLQKKRKALFPRALDILFHANKPSAMMRRTVSTQNTLKKEEEKESQRRLHDGKLTVKFDLAKFSCEQGSQTKHSSTCQRWRVSVGQTMEILGCFFFFLADDKFVLFDDEKKKGLHYSVGKVQPRSSQLTSKSSIYLELKHRNEYVLVLIKVANGVIQNHEDKNGFIQQESSTFLEVFFLEYGFRTSKATPARSCSAKIDDNEGEDKNFSSSSPIHTGGSVAVRYAGKLGKGLDAFKPILFVSLKEVRTSLELCSSKDKSKEVAFVMDGVMPHVEIFGGVTGNDIQKSAPEFIEAQMYASLRSSRTLMECCSSKDDRKENVHVLVEVFQGAISVGDILLKISRGGCSCSHGSLRCLKGTTKKEDAGRMNQQKASLLRFAQRLTRCWRITRKLRFLGNIKVVTFPDYVLLMRGTLFLMLGEVYFTTKRTKGLSWPVQKDKKGFLMLQARIRITFSDRTKGACPFPEISAKGSSRERIHVTLSHLPSFLEDVILFERKGREKLQSMQSKVVHMTTFAAGQDPKDFSYWLNGPSVHVAKLVIGVHDMLHVLHERTGLSHFMCCFSENALKRAFGPLPLIVHLSLDNDLHKECPPDINSARLTRHGKGDHMCCSSPDFKEKRSLYVSLVCRESSFMGMLMHGPLVRALLNQKAMSSSFGATREFDVLGLNFYSKDAADLDVFRGLHQTSSKKTDTIGPSVHAYLPMGTTKPSVLAMLAFQIPCFSALQRFPKDIPSMPLHVLTSISMDICPLSFPENIGTDKEQRNLSFVGCLFCFMLKCCILLILLDPMVLCLGI